MTEEHKPKRRKIRPNNAIAVERAKLMAEKEKNRKAKPEAERKRKKHKAHVTAVDKENKARSSTEYKTGIQETTPDSNRKASMGRNHPVSDYSQAQQTIPLSNSLEPIKLEHPANLSESDSDETDREEQVRAKLASTTISASNSDGTDKQPTRSKKRKRLATPPRPTPAASGYLSASDSDETDDEALSVRRSNKNKVNTGRASKTRNAYVAMKGRIATGSSAPRTSEYVMDSDEELSDTNDTSKPSSSSVSETAPNDAAEDEANEKEKRLVNLAPPRFTKAHLESNRIAFRRTRSYNPSKPPASNLAGRLNDTFIPRKINSDGFITSDSEDDSSGSSTDSDKDDNEQGPAKKKGKSKRSTPYISDSDSDSTDSDDDYDSKEYPPWQRTLGWNRHPERDGEWPKTHRLGYSDKLRLEKRIKKICKREGMTFDDAREIFSSSGRGRLRFYQKIGKIFPNMPLYRLAKTLKEMYHIKRNDAAWTPEEIKKLEELIAIYGVNTHILCQHLNRSPKNINDFVFRQKNVSTNKASKRWTQEEDEKLAQLIVTKAEKHPKTGRILFNTIASEFNGERSQRQIYARYYNIRHRINPDGTLAKNRPATPYEELRYLESLLAQVEEHNLIEESQLDFAKDRGFVNKTFYLTKRAMIDGFERMKIKDILLNLIDRQKKLIKRKQSMGELKAETDDN